MNITPVSFKLFTTQNSNNRLKNKSVANITFNATIDRNNPNYKKWIEKGYKLLNNNVTLKTLTGNILGAAFVTEHNGYAEVIITDDKFKSVGSAGAFIYEDVAESCVNNFYKNSIRHVGTAGYDNLFNYIKKNYPNIKKVKANVITEESLKFHTAYGFKIGKEEVEININNFMDTFMEYRLK